jgi:hypothetical protein
MALDTGPMLCEGNVRGITARLDRLERQTGGGPCPACARVYLAWASGAPVCDPVTGEAGPTPPAICPRCGARAQVVRLQWQA